MLQALAHQVRGDIPAALVSTERALALAGREGYVRIFVDGGIVRGGSPLTCTVVAHCRRRPGSYTRSREPPAPVWSTAHGAEPRSSGSLGGAERERLPAPTLVPGTGSVCTSVAYCAGLAESAHLFR